MVGMDITPTPEPPTPKYPKKRRRQGFVSIRLAGDVGPPCPENLTPQERAIMDEILERGWDSVVMQLLGGAPMITGSPEQKEQEKCYRRYKKVYNKLVKNGLL